MGRFLSKQLFAVFIFFIVGVLASSVAEATVITLVSGKKVKGDILDQNTMQIIMMVNGAPETFYWGEILGVDGKSPEASEPAPEAPVPPPAEALKAVAYYNDEQDSLERFMSVRRGSKPEDNKPPAPAPQAASLPDTGKPSNRNVLQTPDGDFIVIGQQKITKYDQDLNVVKQVDTDPAK